MALCLSESLQPPDRRNNRALQNIACSVRNRYIRQSCLLSITPLSGVFALRRRLFVVFVAFHIPAFHSLKQIKKSNTSQYTTWESATTGSGRGVALAIETATTQTKTFSISGVIRSIPFPPSQPPLLFTSHLTHPLQIFPRSTGNKHTLHGRTVFISSRRERRRWSRTSSASLAASQATK
jgi:hypothetical protein